MKMMKYPNVKNEINHTQSQHDVSPVYGFFKCQEKFGGQKLSSGNLGGGRIKIITKSDKTIRHSRRGMPNYVRRSCSGHGGGIVIWLID